MRTKGARIEALGRVPLLEGLSRRELTHVLELGREMEFLPGDIIVEEGDLGQDFYLLIEGEAELRLPDGRTEPLGPGDYFGEMAVLDGGPRSATIVASTNVSALRIDRVSFTRLLDAHGPIGRKILIVMSRRLRASESSTGRH